MLSISEVQKTMSESTLCFKKLPPFRFLKNNSVKRGPISIIFGIRSPEEKRAVSVEWCLQ